MSTTKVSALAEKTNTNGNEELLINDGGTSKKVIITNVLPDNSVKVKHLDLISTSSVPSLEAKGTSGSTSGYIKLNCSENSHGIKLLGPPHSATADYTLTFPNDDGNNGQKLTTNGSGVLTWTADANTVYTHPNHSGDVTSTADGATVIGAGKVITTKILDDNVTAAKLANSINTDIATGVTANTTANAALPKAGGTMTGNLVMGTNLVDGIDISARDAVLTSTTTTAGAALPKAGGTVTGNIIHNDNVKALFGTGSDLEIYHNASSSYIKDNGTGNLHISTNGASVILQTSQGEKMVEGVKDGAANLYHNNAKKLETTATGVTVTGAIAGATNLGKVLQCLHYSSTSSTSATNATVVIGTVSITKISGTSKLFIMAAAYLGQKTSATNTDGANPTLTISNGATEILKFYHSDVPMWRTDANHHGEYDTHPYFGSLLYSVAAGSHSIYLKLGATGDGVWVNRSIGAAGGYGATGLTVMEIEV
mgnify:CR=1 FL=1